MLHFPEVKLCTKNGMAAAMAVHCAPLLDAGRKIEECFNATNDDTPSIVNCDKNGAVQQIHFMDSGKSPITKVVFQCVKIKVE
jgi:hypothetical protein